MIDQLVLHLHTMRFFVIIFLTVIFCAQCNSHDQTMNAFINEFPEELVHFVHMPTIPFFWAAAPIPGISISVSVDGS
jgi:hypothetical protein